MINLDIKGRPSILSNEKIQVELGYDSGLCIERFLHKSLKSKGALSSTEKEIFILEVAGIKILCSDFEIEEIEKSSDDTEEMISVVLKYKNLGFTSRVCIIGNSDNTIDIIIQLAAEWKTHRQEEVYMHIPFLANLKLNNEEEPVYYFPSNPMPKTDGSSIVQLHSEFPMPLGVFTKSHKEGFSIQFPIIGENSFLWNQNRNGDLRLIKSREELKNHNILLRPSETLSDCFELKFQAIDNGWNEFFCNFRKGTREKLDLSQYSRKDFDWYKNSFYHHFSFAFGKEVYDYKNNLVDIDNLLKQGEEFGGYDSILLWHQYPRLGVDERTQWDFFEDFPGGRQGIKEIVDKSHKLGVTVFLPYKPWDIGPKATQEDSMNNIALLIKETNVDGIFFDTMESVPKGFRESIDKIKPGVVFCTEMHPQKQNSLEMVTGSWDQHWSKVSMPEIDLLRYVLPEHVAPSIARWNVGASKDRLISRAIFNGTGLVIWQDVFGSWLPFSRDQKDKIKKWKKVWKENKVMYLSLNPIPLYPTLQKGLYCNYFPSDDGLEAIYSLYNDRDDTISGELLQIMDKINDCKVTECWYEGKLSNNHAKNSDVIDGSVRSKEILIIKTVKGVSNKS